MQLFLQTCTPDLEKSKQYFKTLNFKIQEGEVSTIAYDQQMKIRIEHDDKARPGITLVKADWASELEELKKITTVLKHEGDHYFVDPSGCRYRLIAGEEVEVPKMDSKCMFGNFAGISLETMNIEKSMQLASILGFRQTAGALDQGWVTCEDDSKNAISFMLPFACPHLFFSPSATFFNGKQNLQIIANIRSVHIPVLEEVTLFSPTGEVDNIVIQEPGGYGFFIFSD